MSRTNKIKDYAVGGIAEVIKNSRSKAEMGLFDKSICVGITGLSQSGKSTFITSLITQLIHHKKSAMNGFHPIAAGNVIGVKIHPLKEKGVKLFPYEESYTKLANEENPSWPESTVDTSACDLELRIKSKKMGRDEYSVFVELRDYPGEWLLDLPLLSEDMTFSRWSAQCNTQYTKEPRKTLLGDLLVDLQSVDPLSEVDEGKLKELSDRFKQFLHECKYKGNGLSLIQPGRFLIPGDVEDHTLLEFIPLLNCSNYSDGQLKKAAKNSYYKVCEKRYNDYIKKLVVPFYKNFFSKIDRQLVLVDVVNALNGGKEYMDDMRQAITNLMDSFSYGKNGFFKRLIGGKTIDKLVFAATKVDQVFPEDHEAVRQLLSVVVGQAYRNAEHKGIKPICEATAAVRSSIVSEHAGKQILKGVTADGKVTGYRHPPIPTNIPVKDEWEPFQQWDLPRLMPPKGVVAAREDVFPHIRMDTVLDHLIGDKCG